MSERNAYNVLGLQKGASDAEIKRAYIELVKKYDPERHTDRFMIIQQAYDRLKDPKRRAKEDIHTYNLIRGDFLLLDEERVVNGAAPSDAEIDEAHQEYQNLAGDAATRNRLILLLMRRSSVSVEKKLWSEAIKDWEEIQRLDPTHVRSRHNLMFAYSTLGLSYAHHGLEEEAIDLWEKALKMNPDSAELLHNLALVYEKIRNYEKSRMYWAQVVTHWKATLDDHGEDDYLKECIIEANRYYGTQLSASESGDDKSNALERYREVLRLKPEDFDARFKIAVTLMEERNFEEAMKELQVLVRQHPRNVEVLNLLGWAQLNGGQVDQAFMTWNKSLEIDPKHPSARENIVKASLSLGRQYRERGLFTPALVYLKKLLRFMPKSGEVWMEIAATYDMKGDMRSAQMHYQKVLELDPKNSVARKALNDLRMRR